MVVPTASSLEARFPTRAGTTSRQNFFETVTEKKLISWFGELGSDLHGFSSFRLAARVLTGIFCRMGSQDTTENMLQTLKMHTHVKKFPLH